MVKKKILRNGQIAIPREIQRLLNIKEGDYLCIYNTNNEIIIDTQEKDDQLNVCIFRHGKVSVPSEIRRIMKIKLGSYLVMEISKEKDKIYLKREFSISSSIPHLI